MTDVNPRIIAHYQNLKSQFGERDQNQAFVSTVRRGDGHLLIKDLWPEDTFPKSITANILDTAARDLGEMAGVIPQISCQPLRQGDAAKNRADLRTKIAQGYLEHSRFGPQLVMGADWFFSATALIIAVEPDWDAKMPTLRVDNPVGAYYTLNLKGETVAYYRRWEETGDSLAAKFPEHAREILGKGKADYWSTNHESGNTTHEVVKYYGPHKSCIFMPEKGLVLREAPNPLGKTGVFIAERTRWDNTPRGQFDQMLWVQLARARMALYAMEAVDQSVNAPLAVTPEVGDVEIDSRGIIRSERPDLIRRVGLDVPPGAFAENELLSREERLSARYPEGMTGNIDASIITGSGVNALLNQVVTQVKVAQDLFALVIRDALSFALRMDEAYWPDEEKTAASDLSGSWTVEKYVPSRHIKGDYSVQATYGHVQGLDASRALVYLLQLHSVGAMSKETMMRLQGQLTKSFDPSEELRRIDVENLNAALMAGVQGLAAAFPQMAEMGQDPVMVLQQVARVIEGVQKGKPTHEVVLEAFMPTPEEEAAAQAADPMAQLLAAEGGGGMPAGPGGGPDDLAMVLAGLTPAGQANLQHTVSRMKPTPGQV